MFYIFRGVQPVYGSRWGRHGSRRRGWLYILTEEVERIQIRDIKSCIPFLPQHKAGSPQLPVKLHVLKVVEPSKTAPPMFFTVADLVQDSSPEGRLIKLLEEPWKKQMGCLHQLPAPRT